MGQADPVHNGNGELMMRVYLGNIDSGWGKMVIIIFFSSSSSCSWTNHQESISYFLRLMDETLGESHCLLFELNAYLMIMMHFRCRIHYRTFIYRAATYDIRFQWRHANGSVGICV